MSNIVNIEDKAIVGLKHNPKIWIAVGKSRFDTKWQNKHVLYGELLRKLSDPKRTSESIAEYAKLPKNKRDEIKDVGGFVGGALEGGHRKSNTVKTRSLLTFDFDNAPQDLIADLYLNESYAWAIYSTHSHTPEKPRYRLIVPLDRDVSPDEYEAIMRRMSEGYGMEYLDASTCQPSRLMYWPSCSSDAQYVFEYNDGEILKADDILASYPDWKDCSYWPYFEDELKPRRDKVNKRQQDPTAKRNLVGVFCRTYPTIQEVIDKFLPEVYTATDKPDRYTYAHGSTFGGLVIYDDGAFCYSNHATDPACGQDLNAFDLVRLHLFSDRDADVKDGTPATRLPSYLAMLDLIREDPECLATREAERAARALEDFGEELEEGSDTEAVPEETKAKPKGPKLSVNRKGEIEPTAVNVLKILESDPALQCIRYNEFFRAIENTGPLPWRRNTDDWTDSDDSRLFVHLAKNYAEFKRSDIRDAIAEVAGKRAYDPVKDYFNGLPEWDGKPRADSIFIDYLGAEDSDYVRTCTHKWLLAGVARTFIEGIKFDYVPVLAGPPGIGKSTLVGRLGVKWFSDSLSFEDMKDKTAAEKIQGIFINEISELKGMRKIDVETIKSFISRQEDNYRPAYGRRKERRKRRCIFVGTSNSEDFLKDNTGNRRFWPIQCSRTHRLNAWEMTDEDVAQIWAEIFFFWDNIGERDLVLPHKLEEQAEGMQTQALEHDDRMGLVAEYLDKLLPEDWDSMDTQERRDWLDGEDRTREGVVQRKTVSIMEVWAECFKRQPADKKRADSDDITRMLLQLGWERVGRETKRIYPYGPQGFFERKQK